jgi:hypothetical protein
MSHVRDSQVEQNHIWSTCEVLYKKAASQRFDDSQQLRAPSSAKNSKWAGKCSKSGAVLKTARSSCCIATQATSQALPRDTDWIELCDLAASEELKEAFKRLEGGPMRHTVARNTTVLSANCTCTCNGCPSHTVTGGTL